MHKSQKLWRALFILLLVAALCGSFALPTVNRPVMAAPMMQATSCLGVTIAQWTFNNVTDPIIGTGTFNSGGGISAVSYAAGNPDQAVSFTNWTTVGSLDPTDYVEFLVPTVGRNTIGLSFDYRATGTGPQTMEVQYSVDGGANFALLGSPLTLNRDSNYYNLVFDFSAVPAIDDNLNAVFRIYAYGSNGNPGRLNFDNAIFTGNCIFPAPTLTPTPTFTSSPTSTPSPTSTAVTPRAVIINEVAWGGTKASSSDEWFELYNTTGTNIDLKGWTLTAEDGNPSIPLSGIITASDPYFVFARYGAVFSDIVPDKTYSSGSFGNDGDILYLQDPEGNQVDTANLDGGAWNAGSASPNYATMERNGLMPDSSTSWSTYAGTTPVAHDRNGNPINGTPGQANWISTVTITPSPTISLTPTRTNTPTVTSTFTGLPMVMINEVAWAGTSGTTTDDEWIELYNPGALPVDISGWHLYGDDNTLNKVGSPNITLQGTIPGGPNGGYFLLERNELTTSVTADQVYSTGDLLNGGERLYLKNSSGTVIDTANLDGGTWPAGTASTTTAPFPTYASMERVAGTGNTWVTYNGTQPVAYDRNGGPIKGTPGSANWINSATITTITSDLPDPSLVNQTVTVTVRVIGGKTVPTGKVNISAANTSSCSLTLSNGTGSCTVKFTSTGAKTLIAAYVPDSTHTASSDTEPHQVSTSASRTSTPVPSPPPPPPPPLLAINEFVPRPGHDWNNDGIVNTGDEYIEVLNHGVVNVNLSGYSLDDEVNVGSAPFRLPALTLRPGERYVFYGSETGILLGDGGDAVRLLKPNGQLGDAYNYTVVERPDQSFCRLPDNGGADDWNQNCYPTPGLQNSLNEGETTSANNPEKELYCPIADTLPDAFAEAECQPFGNNIWRPEFWDQTGWYGDQNLPGIQLKWPVFAN